MKKAIAGGKIHLFSKITAGDVWRQAASRLRTYRALAEIKEAIAYKKLRV